MYKCKFLFLVVLTAIIAGCGGPGATTPTSAPPSPAAASPTAQAAPATAAPTSAPAATAPGGAIALTPAGVASAPKLDPAGMCKAANAPKPVPGFTASLPSDQVRGQANATLTLYEYSDFQ